jgi:hypothetical protein
MQYYSFEISGTVEMRSKPDNLADRSDCPNTGTSDRIQPVHGGLSEYCVGLPCAALATGLSYSLPAEFSAHCKLNTEGRMPMFELAC